MSAPVRILGIGSPFGDDRTGWLAVDCIRASTWYRAQAPGTISAESFDRPGPALLSIMDGASHAVLIDTMQSGAPPGTLRHVELDELALSDSNFASGHSFGLADTLLLGRALALLPPRLTLLAVEAGRAGSDDGLSCEVRAALPALVQCVEACVTRETQRIEGRDGGYRVGL